jgi:hypothetical protein
MQPQQTRSDCGAAQTVLMCSVEKQKSMPIFEIFEQRKLDTAASACQTLLVLLTDLTQPSSEIAHGAISDGFPGQGYSQTVAIKGLNDDTLVTQDRHRC